MATVLVIGAVAPPLFSQTQSAPAWEFSAAAFTYFVPDETNYVSPYFKADRNRLHLETRYNYEDRRTGSGWIGYNFSTGNTLIFEITPMFGVVFGRTDGVAPGALISLTYKKFDLSTENEYVFNSDESVDSFFYTWSEVGYTPVTWLRVGLVGQRTRVYKTPLDVQRGLFAGVSYKVLDFTTYVFNPGWTDPTVVLAAAFHF